MNCWEATARELEFARIKGPDEAAMVVWATFGGTVYEHRQVVLGLDEQHRLVGMAPRAPGRSHEPLVAGHVVDIVRELGAVGAVAATLGPGGDQSAPGATEVAQFRELAGTCAAEGVALFDWLVFAGYKWWTMREWSGGWGTNR